MFLKAFEIVFSLIQIFKIKNRSAELKIFIIYFEKRL